MSLPTDDAALFVGVCGLCLWASGWLDDVRLLLLRRWLTKTARLNRGSSEGI